MTRAAHIVLGDSAGGTLRQALGAEAVVHVVRDDLSHGPLTPSPARAAHMRELYAAMEDGGYDPADIPDDAFEHQAGLEALAAAHDSLTVWAAECGSELTLLALVCHALQGSSVELLRIAVPPALGMHATGIQNPEELRSALESAITVAPEARKAATARYDELLAAGSVVRRYADGRVQSRPLDVLDDDLLAHCSETPELVARVVGRTMADTDGHNFHGDIFLLWRLAALAAGGRVAIEGQGPSFRRTVRRL